jgi:predicted LPLAT superfamily acyltransferase
MLERLDPARPERLVEVSEIGPATAVELDRRIDAGELVVIAGDRVPLGSGRTVTVPFLGAPARWPVGPYVLASLLRCPLFLLACRHDGHGYRIELSRLAERVVLPRAGREAALADHAAAYAAALGSLLAQSPYDWFNFHPFWEPSE